MDSTDLFRTFMPGLIDGGELGLALVYDGASSGNADSLQTALESARENWTVLLVDTSKMDFSGFISGLGGGEAGSDGKVTQNVTIKVSGKPILTDVA